MINLGPGPLGLWFYVYHMRYKTFPEIQHFNKWEDVLISYNAPPPFGDVDVEVIIGSIPIKLLSTNGKGNKKGINLKDRFKGNHDYRELVLIVDIESNQDSNVLSNFISKNKTWIKSLESDPIELRDLYKLLRRVLTGEAYEWVMSRYRNIPMRIKQQLPSWARKFNNSRSLLDIDEIRRDLGDTLEVTSNYCNYLGHPKGNSILMDMKSSDIWSTFFSINDYKSPVEMLVNKACPELMSSLCMLDYAVKNSYIDIKGGALVLNSWWVSILLSKSTRPWRVSYSADSLRELRKELGMMNS